MVVIDLYIFNLIVQNFFQFRNFKDVCVVFSVVGVLFQQFVKEDYDDDYFIVFVGLSVEEWVDKEFGGFQIFEEIDLYMILWM